VQLPDLKNKRAVILGLQGSGKTELAKSILRGESAHLVYDVHHEYTGLNQYLAQYKQCDRSKKDDPALLELNALVTRILDVGKVRCFGLDEANRFCPNHYPLPASIVRLNDDNRHDKIGFISIARRPSQLNTDLVELAHYLFIFRLCGRNDLMFLDDTAAGLADAVKGLQDYEFVVVDPSKHFTVHPPMPFKKGL
jgi:hypothetical protein